MFWNVNSVMTFLAAEHGVVTRQFDPLFHDDDPPPTVDLGLRLPAEAGLDWEASPRTSGLSLLATLTGTEPAQPSWLTVPGVRFWGHRFCSRRTLTAPTRDVGCPDQRGVGRA